MIQTKEQYVGKMLKRIVTDGHVLVFSEIFDTYVMPNNKPCKSVAWEAFREARDRPATTSQALRENMEKDRKDFEAYWQRPKAFAAVAPEKPSALDAEIDRINDGPNL